MRRRANSRSMRVFATTARPTRECEWTTSRGRTEEPRPVFRTAPCSAWRGAARILDAMPFTHRALRFFRQLARNNEKPWFEAHREEYETEVRQPMRGLIEDLDTRFAQFAPEIGGDPKRSMFRINRDIRFSKDKSPYKTNAACWFHHLNAARSVGSDADAGSAGYYFHLEPGGRSMIGAGIWMPPRPQLNKLRGAIAGNPKEFDKMARSIPRRFGGLDDEGALKRMPR